MSRHPFDFCMSFFLSKRTYLLSMFLLTFITSFSQSNKRSKKSSPHEKLPATKVDISEHLKIFGDNTSQATYRIAVCADVPNNKKPMKVAYNQQTGHVFVILQKIYFTGDTVSRVFGFYPNKGLSTLFFKKSKSLIKDNSYREYDVEISKALSASEFDTVLAKAIFYAGRKYHMNRYNCYDYAVLIYNSVAEKQLPITHIRFPFIFGKGGSPVSVYRDLQKIQASDTIMATQIRFAVMMAPLSNGRTVENSSELSVNQSIER